MDDLLSVAARSPLRRGRNEGSCCGRTRLGGSRLPCRGQEAPQSALGKLSKNQSPASSVDVLDGSISFGCTSSTLQQRDRQEGRTPESRRRRSSFALRAWR